MYEARGDYKKEEAEVYDEKRFSSLKGRLYQWLQKSNIVKALSTLPPKARVLDLPCGTGRVTEVMAGMGFVVTAGDLSVHMLEVARKKLKNSPNVAGFEQVDAERLKYKDNSFDCVTSIKFMHLLPREVQDRVLKNLARVSRDLIVVTYAYKGSFSWIKQYVFMKRFYKVNPSSGHARTVQELEGVFGAMGLKVQARLFTLRLFSEEVLYVLKKTRR
ncbi:MAG: methyltransferase domain-containing protein, partial [Deltaproteobacteria bacterium]